MRLRARITAAAVLAATVALPFPALAKQPHAASQALQILPDEAEAFSRTEAGRVSTLSGRPLSLYRVNYPVAPGKPEQMARQYLVARASQLGLQPDASDLRVVGTREGEASTTVAFEQTYEGLPVYGSDVAVSINRQNLVTFVMNGTKPVALKDVTPAVAQADARARVLAHLRPEGALQLDRQDLVVYHAQGASRLAWRFRMVPTASPTGDWESLVDAKTGELFRVQDHSCYRAAEQPLVPVNGTATVFAPDPLSSAPGVPLYGTTGYVDGNDADTPQLTAELEPVTLLDIDLTGGLHTLRGPFAEIVDTEAPFNGLFPQASSSFNSTRFPDVFESANTYYHIDRFMRYINTPSGSGGLGLTVMPNQYSGGVRFDPQGLSGQDNSHYTPGTGVVAFGEGGVDDDEDADVIIHELGHGLHDWVTASPGVSQVNGLSEGTGDYFAQSYSRAYGNVPSANPAWHWVFSWDGHNPFWGGRTTNWPNLYPGGLTGQIHTDGQIWATCLMRIWNQLGAVKTDRVVLAGLALTTSSTNQDDAAQALMQAAFDLGYPLADQQVMLAEFTATGYTVVIVPVELMSAGVE